MILCIILYLSLHTYKKQLGIAQFPMAQQLNARSTAPDMPRPRALDLTSLGKKL